MNVEDKLVLNRGAVLKNRLIMAPMGTQQSYFNDIISNDELVYYKNRSEDVAAIITGGAQVQEIGRSAQGMFGIYSDDFLPGLTALSNQIKTNGSKAILQLFHAGRMVKKEDINGKQAVGPSSVRGERPGLELPRELTEQEIFELINDFKLATIRAIQAGFDGIEIHGANTFLIQQFFSPASNLRDDLWGGSREKRFRFIDILTETLIKTVDEQASSDFIIGYRLSPEEFENPGISFEDTLYLVNKLSNKNIDYLHISMNDYQRISLDKNYQAFSILEYISKIINKRVALIGLGGVVYKNDVDNILKIADLVGSGQQLLIDPNWARKILNHQDELVITKKMIGVEGDFTKYPSLLHFVHLMRQDKSY